MQHDDFDSHLPQPCKAGGVIPLPGETEAGKGAGGCLPQAHSRYGLGLSDSSHSPYYLPTSLATPGLSTTQDVGHSYLGGGAGSPSFSQRASPSALSQVQHHWTAGTSPMPLGLRVTLQGQARGAPESPRAKVQARPLGSSALPIRWSAPSPMPCTHRSWSSQLTAQTPTLLSS